MTYPKVVGELETMRAVVAGASISRYGDGEFKICRNNGIKSQQPNLKMSARLRQILLDSGECLIGIPNIHSDTPKSRHWLKYLQYSEFLTKRTYYSSFITRPDSAPWINTPDYWRLIESLWLDQDVTVVRGSGKSLTSEDLYGARQISEVIAPRQHAWGEYKSILGRILATRPTRVLLGLGPTATALAVDLCARGIHAIDLGHTAMFLRKFRRGEAMVVTDEDRAIPA